ncbi:Cullin family-domain-containing protein [Blakeslea trispora]|nr:Cullin family-domain-containing protein [Blakeslea trispora]
MTDRESVKRPRLGEQIAPQYQPLPFSQYLSKSLHNQKHPILSDKKLIVYDLKIDGSTLEQEQDYRQLSWKRLQRAIHAIQTEQPCPESLEVLYQLCEDLCQYGHTRELYEHLHAECNQYVHVQFESFSHQPEDIDYLAHIHSAWKKYCDQMSQIRCLFLYLDRTYVASTTKTGTIWNMAMDLFREHFMMYDDVWKKTLAGILELIRLERSGQSIDESFLQSNIRMLMDLQLYHTSFEQQLLIQTKAFYEQEGDQLLSHMDVFDYLEHVSTRVHQESILRVKNYFDKSIKSSLQFIVERELLTKRIEVILTQCNLHLFQDSDYDKFSLLYRLLHKINHLDICAKYFTNYIKKKGSSIMCSKTSAKEKVMMLSQFESQADEIVDHSFEGDEQFVDGLKDGIDYFVNLRDNNAVKILAKHTDQILRSTSYDDSLLEKGMFLFRYLQAKDTFELVYKRDLAKRLLLNKTTKSGEKAMLTKMKKICGAGYTGKMEGMVKDIEKSTELMHEFKAQAIYCQFYASKFEKRILTWYHSLGVCEVKASYPRVSFSLQASP